MHLPPDELLNTKLYELHFKYVLQEYLSSNMDFIFDKLFYIVYKERNICVMPFLMLSPLFNHAQMFKILFKDYFLSHISPLCRICSNLLKECDLLYLFEFISIDTS